MPSPRAYTTAGAFRRALEERLKRTSMSEQVDLNRLRRKVAFDRLLARLFLEDPPPRGPEGRLCAGTPLQDGSVYGGHRSDSAAGPIIAWRRPEPDRTGHAANRGGRAFRRLVRVYVRTPCHGFDRCATAVLAIRSKLQWTSGSSPDSTWTLALVMWCRRRWKRSSAGTGWDSLASSPRGFG